VAAAIGAVCLAGVMGVGAGVAGAGAGAGNPFRHAAPGSKTGVKSGAALVPGTYTWIGDNSTLGTITFTAGNTWSSNYDDDGGEWVQSGKSFAMDMTSGRDGHLGCLFAAKVGVGGTSLVKGAFSCSVTDYSGIWSASPSASTAPAATRGDAFASHGAAPRASIVLGSYKWFIGSHHDGRITYAMGNAWSSTYHGDGGSWVQGGTTMAMAVTEGGDGAGGCIFVGQVAKTGTAVSSASKPGAWICPGDSSSGTWYVS
jgi:hypothetical protein